jgi:F0F1-type ATP synthase membrane subunit b/b'
MNRVARHARLCPSGNGIAKMVNEVSKVLGLDKNKDLIMKIIQFVLLFGAIYGVYNDATKNLDAAKAARDKQIAELVVTINVNREELNQLKRENEHLREWLRNVETSRSRHEDRLESRFDHIESVLMTRK